MKKKNNEKKSVLKLEKTQVMKLNTLALKNILGGNLKVTKTVNETVGQTQSKTDNMCTTDF